MSFSVWLDVAVGLAAVYLGASLFVTIIGEYVSQLLGLRGLALCGAVQKLFTGTVKAQLQKNPALAPYFETEFLKQRVAPSYVDPVMVARALLGIGRSPSGPSAALPSELEAVVGAVGTDLDKAVAAVSHWVDGSLTVLSESFKRNQRLVSLATAALLAVVLNLDTIAIAQRLYQDRDARDQLTSAATDVVNRVDRATFDGCYAASTVAPGANGKAATVHVAKDDPRCAALVGLVGAVQRRNASMAQLPVGWAGVSWGLDPAGLVKAAGWLLTALALSLGAPFWFDLLAKFVDVRNGIRRPDVKASLEASGAKPER